MSGDGSFGFQPGFTADSPNAFAFAFVVVRTTSPTFRQYVLRGVRSTDGSPFAVDLVGANSNGLIVVRATLTGSQVSGPGR